MSNGDIDLYTRDGGRSGPKTRTRAAT